MSIREQIIKLNSSLPDSVDLVAVSKTKPAEAVMEAYEAGQRIFGENKIQELVEKEASLPKDIEWHMIGHVQRNKVKYMAPFVSLIHAVDSERLLKEVNKQAKKYDRNINCLIQIKLAKEDSKFGMDFREAKSLLESDTYQSLSNIKVVGLMGMATFTEDQTIVESEFKFLKQCYDDLVAQGQDFSTLSMGMSGDYPLAIKHGSTMIRIGSQIFGARNYS